MEEIIKNLEDQIQICIDKKDSLDITDFIYQIGVLITANDAKQIVGVLKVFHTQRIDLECSRCGTVYKATPSLLGICCTTAVEHSTSGICGGQLMMKP